MRNPAATLALSLALASAHFGLSARACVHPPRAYPGKLGSAVQEYLFYRDSGLVHLIANQRIQADSALPGDLAWVIPLPSVPVLYRTESDALFEKLFQATEVMKKGALGMRSLSAPGGFAVHQQVKVGEYAITPIEILDTASGTEINDWLFRNGYHRVPVEGLRYYLRPGACFLAVKVSRLPGREAALHPLHIAFRAKEARVPLKFFANAGVFDVYVYTVTPKARPLEGKALERWGFRADGMKDADYDPGLAERLQVQGMPWEGSVLQRFLARGVNGEGNSIAGWKDDPLLPLGR